MIFQNWKTADIYIINLLIGVVIVLIYEMIIWKYRTGDMALLAKVGFR